MHGTTVNIISMHIHSSLFVLNFMLQTCRPDSADDARTTQKPEPVRRRKRSICRWCYIHMLYPSKRITVFSHFQNPIASLYR